MVMGLPLGPLMANISLCHLEDKLTHDGVMPTLYRKYVDDTLAKIPSSDAAVHFLSTLNSLHPACRLQWSFLLTTRSPLLE